MIKLFKAMNIILYMNMYQIESIGVEKHKCHPNFDIWLV